MNTCTPPVAFEIVEKDGIRVATNGRVTVTAFDAEGAKIFRRRKASVTTFKPPGEDMLPKLNGLASRLLDNPSMTAEEVGEALRTLADGIAPPPKTTMQSEWCVVSLNGVNVYVFDGGVIVSTKDMYP